MPLALLAALAGGCAQEHVSVTVRGNGTWTRRAVYSVTVPELGIPDQSGSEVSDAFALPSGPEWKLTRQKTKDERRVVAERTLHLNQSIENDIVVKETSQAKNGLPAPGDKPGVHLVGLPPGGPAKALTSNIVTVQQGGLGDYKYTETIHWTGDAPESFHKMDEKEIALVRGALPADLATDENVKFLADSLGKEFALALMGPPSPLLRRLPIAISAPETFARLLTKRMGTGLSAALQSRFGDSMTAARRTAVVARLVEGITDEIRQSGPGQASDAQSSGQSGATSGASITVAVRLPGRVTETNGVADPVSGDVSWSFYPEAAAFGDIKLSASSMPAHRNH